MAPGGGFSPDAGAMTDTVANQDGQRFVGTSFACALASGIVACAFGPDAGPKLPDAQVWEQLSIRAIQYENYDPNLDGWGLINLREPNTP